MIDETLKLDPDNAPAHMVMGEELLARGNAAAAVRELETARGKSPDTVKIRLDLLRAYVAAGRKDDANGERAAIERLNQQSTHP